MFVRSSGDRATILHADLDSFYASVEQRDDPTLRGRPIIVGSIVLAASYPAKAHGIRTAMGARMARALCPDVVQVPPRFSAYLEASRRVFAIFEDTTPIVEGLSIDEAFLDVGGLGRLTGSPLQIAEKVRRRVADEVGLPITIGIARTKFLAKVASAVAKPDGLLEVEPGREREFLHPLPVQRLWGVGAVTAERLHAIGLHTVADVAATDEATLISALGPHGGRHVRALATLRDPRQVEVGRRRSSIGAQRALGRGRHSPADLDLALKGLVDRVCGRMRRAGRKGRTVMLRLRFDDYTRATRSRTLWHASDSTAEILAACRELRQLAHPLIHDRGITLIGIAVSGFDSVDQPELPFDDLRSRQVDNTLDAVRTKFGSGALVNASLLGRDSGMSVPLLPD